MKKLAGLLTALALLVSVCGMPTFAFEDEDWTFEYADGCEKSEDIYGTVSASGAVSGKNGLYLYNNLTNMPITAKSGKISFKGGTEYKLTLWTSKNVNYTLNAFKLGIEGILTDKNIIRMTTVSESGSYMQVQVSFTPESDITTNISIKLNTRYAFENRAAFAIVDDIVITDGAEEIYTCGFENIDTGGSAFSQQEFSASRYPTDVTATGWHGTIGLSWKNPTASELEKIVVLDNENGKVIADSDSDDIKQGLDFETGSISTAAGALNNVWVYDCIDDELRSFVLRFMYSGDSYNNATDYVVYGKSNTTGLSCGINGYEFYIGKLEKSVAFNSVGWELDKETVRSGNASLRLYSNLKGGAGYVEFYTDSNTQLEKGKKYRITIWAKGEDVSDTNFMTDWDSKACELGAFRCGGSAYDWKEITYDYSAEGATTISALRWQIYGRIKSLWLDDISIYELDEDMNPIGDNLVPNGDFEQGYKDPAVSDVENPYAVSTAEGVYLSWSLPKRSAEKIKLYEVSNGDRTEIATLDGEMTDVYIKDAAFDTEHEYAITMINASGFESEGVECSVYHERQGIVCGDIMLKRNGVYVSDINEPGEYIISVSFATDDTASRNTELFVMYTDGGMLKQSDFSFGKINTDSMKTAECTITIDEPTDTDLLKVFFWNSIEEMDAIKAAVQFE